MLDGTNSEIIDALAEYAELIESGNVSGRLVFVTKQ